MGWPAGKAFDRATLAAALLLALLLGRELATLRASATPAAVEGGPVVAAPPRAAPERLDRVRVLVDGNGAGAREEARLLVAEHPRDPAGWELLARFHQGAGEAGEAVRAWAKAVRLRPELMDLGASAYRGDLIEELAEAEFARLRGERSRRDLSAGEKEVLEEVYYLRRRLAGGCE